MSRLRASILSLVFIVLAAAPFCLKEPVNPYWSVVLLIWTLLQAPIILIPLILKPSPTAVIGLGLGTCIYFVICSQLPYFHAADSSLVYIFSIPGAIVGGFVATHWLTSRNIVDWRKQIAMPAVGVLAGAGVILGAWRAMW
jgi:hypothetical protein